VPGAVVKAHRGGDNAMACCFYDGSKEAVAWLVAVDAVGGWMRLVQLSRLTEEETMRWLVAGVALAFTRGTVDQL
jgi:hypothetical protein